MDAGVPPSSCAPTSVQHPLPVPLSTTSTFRLQVPSLGIERRFSLKDAEESDNLLTCIEDGDIEDLHRLLSDLPGGETSVLTTPSLLAKHKMRTPLMAAAATGDLATFTATLQAFNQQYSNKVRPHFCLMRSNSPVD